MNIVSSITDRFHSLSGGAKRNIVVVLSLVVLMGFAYLIVTAFTPEHKVRTNSAGRKVQYDLLTGRDSKSLGVDVIVARLDSINKRIDRVEEGNFSKGAKTAKTTEANQVLEAEQTDKEIGWDSMQDDPKLSEDDRELLKEIRARRNGGDENKRSERQGRKNEGKTREVVDNNNTKYQFQSHLPFRCSLIQILLLLAQTQLMRAKK